MNEPLFLRWTFGQVKRDLRLTALDVSQNPFVQGWTFHDDGLVISLEGKRVRLIQHSRRRGDSTLAEPLL